MEEHQGSLDEDWAVAHHGGHLLDYDLSGLEGGNQVTNKREDEILLVMLEHPGYSARELRQFGIRKSDASFIVMLENDGKIIYETRRFRTGWFVVRT